MFKKIKILNIKSKNAVISSLLVKNTTVIKTGFKNKIFTHKL